MPSLLIRVASLPRILRFWSSERTEEPRTSKASVTLLLTLLTFWPPGPPLRDAVKVSSFSGIESPGTMGITTKALSPAGTKTRGLHRTALRRDARRGRARVCRRYLRRSRTRRMSVCPHYEDTDHRLPPLTSAE